ncbi:MAG: ABC transporter permease [Acidobacteriota bacterium]
MDALLALYSVWRRDLVRFARQRSRVVGALLTPVLFWLVLGSGLGQSFQAGSERGYLEYYFPGTLALVVLFTAIFSTISVIEDRNEGFLQGALASPAPRAALVLGKALGSATLATGNAALCLVLVPVVGLPVSALAVPGTLVMIALMGVGLSGLGVLLAWGLRSTQGFHALMNVLLVPMWLTSGAVFPADGAAGWMQAVMRANPLTYGLEGLRAALYGGGSAVPFVTAAAVMLALAAATILLATLLAMHRRSEA